MKNFPTFAIPNNESCCGKEKELIEGIWMKFFFEKRFGHIKNNSYFCSRENV